MEPILSLGVRISKRHNIWPRRNLFRDAARKPGDRPDGSEFWSARDLMAPLGYDNWQNFAQAIDRAKVAAQAQGNTVTSLFIDASKKTSGRPQQDVQLARFACYLVAMNGDPRKPEVAAAQAYFAIRTREAETTPALTGPELIAKALIELCAIPQSRHVRPEHFPAAPG